MRKILFFIVLCSTMGVGYATKHTITNVGNTFTPDTIRIEAGDDVEFSIGSYHDAVEVTKDVWDANGNTAKSGGFSVPFGGGEIVLSTPGTYYYVCTPHASLGMKGVIIVEGSSSAIPTVSSGISGFEAYTGQGGGFLTVSYTLEANAEINIRLINLVGSEVAVLLKEPQYPGQFTYTYPLGADLVPGLYLVAIQADNRYSVKKVILR